MTLEDLLKEKGISKYRLAKDCSLATSAIIKLCGGDIQVERCAAGTIQRIAKVLGVNMEDIMALEYPKKKKQKTE